MSMTNLSYIYYLNSEHGICLQIYDYIWNQHFTPLRTPQPNWARCFSSFNPPPVMHMTPMNYHQRRQLEDIEQQLQEQKSTTMVHPTILKIWRRRQKSGSSKRCSTCQCTRYMLSVTTPKQSSCLAPQTGSLCRW